MFSKVNPGVASFVAVRRFTLLGQSTSQFTSFALRINITKGSLLLWITEDFAQTHNRMAVSISDSSHWSCRENTFAVVIRVNSSAQNNKISMNLSKSGLYLTSKAAELDQRGFTKS